MTYIHVFTCIYMHTKKYTRREKKKYQKTWRNDVYTCIYMYLQACTFIYMYVHPHTICLSTYTCVTTTCRRSRAHYRQACLKTHRHGFSRQYAQRTPACR